MGSVLEQFYIGSFSSFTFQLYEFIFVTVLTHDYHECVSFGSKLMVLYMNSMDLNTVHFVSFLTNSFISFLYKECYHMADFFFIP